MPVPAQPLTVGVRLGERSYPIRIGAVNLTELGRFLQERRPARHAVVVSDHRVAPLYGEAAHECRTAAGLRVALLTVPAGESSKSVEQAATLWEQLLAAGADRQTVLVALGGGVVGDLAGFVAATYARG